MRPHASAVEYAGSDGAACAGVLALPAGTAAVGAVVVLQEWWGVNAHIRSVVERWAAAGFLALAPDLYDGVIATTTEEAGAKMRGLNRPRALAHIEGAIAFARTHTRSSSRVLVTGYCLGGALAFATAARVPGLAGVVPFYGITDADWSRIEAPVLAHFCATDDWATPDAARAAMAAITAGGGHMTLHIYEAPHAFCNDSRPEVYRPDLAALAWDRTLAFARALMPPLS